MALGREIFSHYVYIRSARNIPSNLIWNVWPFVKDFNGAVKKLVHWQSILSTALTPYRVVPAKRSSKIKQTGMF